MADLLYYRLTRRGNEVTSEVICKAHYDEASRDGGSMAPLSDREIGAGYKQTANPYVGDRRCATCEERAGRSAGA